MDTSSQESLNSDALSQKEFCIVDLQRDSLTVRPINIDTSTTDTPQAAADSPTTVLVVIMELYLKGWHIATYLSIAIMMRIICEADPNV